MPIDKTSESNQKRQSTPPQRLSRLTVGSGVLLLIIGILRVFGFPPATPDVELSFDLFAGAVLIGAGVGILALELRWFDPPQTVRSKPGAGFYAIAVGLMAFAGAFILRCGMHQIGGYDHGSLVDFGWRLYEGQKPYVDFPCTVPPAYSLGTEFAFQWFGVSWHSIIEFTALFSVVTFAWSLFLLMRIFGPGSHTLLWAMAVQVFSMMLVSFWWYNSITSVSAVLFILSATYWLRCPRDAIAMISYGASLFLMATMKANDAAVMIPGFSLVLFVSRSHRWKTLGVSLVSFALFLVLLSLNQFSFFGLLNAYWYISPHGASLFPFLVDHTPDERRLALLETTSFVLPAVIALSRGRRNPHSVVTWIPAAAMIGALIAWLLTGAALKPLAASAITVPILLALGPGRASLNSPGIWIGVIGLLGGIYGCLTNSEIMLVNLPPVFIAAVLLIAECRSISNPDAPLFQIHFGWVRYFSFLCVVLGCLALAQGYSRARIRSVGPGKFFQYDDSTHIIQTGFFKGLRCGDTFYNVLRDIGKVVQRDPSATVWFGVRMQWAYAAFNKPSPREQPVVWDPFTMFERTKEQLYFDHLLQDRYQIMIELKNDASFPNAETARLMNQYKVDGSYRTLTVLRLKQ